MQRLHFVRFGCLVIVISSCAVPCPARAAEGDDLMAVVKAYADAMVERGRDVYGPVKTGLLLSAMDRHTLKPLTTAPAPPEGVRDIDRVGQENGPLVGANLFHDENLLRLLYAMSRITGDDRYGKAVDESLKWFFENAAWPETGLLPWGEHMNWQVVEDRRATRCREPRHELGRPWMLWDRSFELAPKACANFAHALWEHQIADHETGAFDRHASPHKHAPATGYDLPRHAGMYILAWSKAYKHTRDEKFLHDIDVMIRHYENKRDAKTGLISAWRDSNVAWPLSTMSMSLECWASAADVPDELARRLRAFSTAEDKAFLALDHDPARRGYVVSAVKQTGIASGQIGRDKVQERTFMWGDKGGEATTAMVSLLCVARNEQVPSDGYKKLILTAAKAYLNQRPESGRDLWPLAMSQAITLQMSAYRLSGDKAYLAWARTLAEEAVATFWPDGPLPRASAKTDHYETLTGGDSLALALLDVATADTAHAKFVPGNTIDR